LSVLLNLSDKAPNGLTNRSFGIYKEIKIFTLYVGSTMSNIQQSPIIALIPIYFLKLSFKSSSFSWIIFWAWPYI